MNKTIDSKEQAKTVDTFLKFCYCFPYDIKDRFINTFGESMGKHFYKKYRGYCKKKEDNFTAMIYTVGDMTPSNKALFMEMVNKYYTD